MIDLTVIIVNYNVRYYLEQCLSSVAKAIEPIAAEVYVVDNNSSDGSMDVVKQKFPWVKCIENKENVGFSKANNQALEQSNGRYSVLLNPDTVVAEDAFKQTIDFMDRTPEAGGVGVRMLDGRGQFLPESKRGLPTPLVAFFKISGLSNLFPNNKLFAKYHLGHLDELEINEIEILSGACMFLRKSTLDEVGLLDNSFFMYGEDIDLSYRITLGGYKNFYFPKAQIIHYKGESTKKSSFNYVYVFYNAMAIFARKHFTKKGGGLFATLIAMAIYASAGAALLARTILKFALPICDALLLGITVLMLELHFSPLLPMSLSPASYVLLPLLWMLTMTLVGGYDKPVKVRSIPVGAILGTILLAGSYWLVGEDLSTMWPRISLTGSGILVAFTLSRTILHLLRVDGHRLKASSKKRFLVIGHSKAAETAKALVWQINFGVGHISDIAPGQEGTSELAKEIKRHISIYRIDSVVFCAGDLSDKLIIELMQRVRRFGLEFKIARPGCEYLIGSHSIASLEDLFILDQNSVRNAMNRRNKRIFDVCISLLLFLLLPLSIWVVEHKSVYIRNIFQVLLGKGSWVGYGRKFGSTWTDLPKLKAAVLAPYMALTNTLGNKVLERRTNIIYAKDYSVFKDLRLVLQNFRELGGKA